MQKGIILYLFLLLLPFLLGCSTLLEESESGIDLEITSFSADAISFSATIVNNGTLPATTFEVSFTLDEIYNGDPDTKSVTYESLAAGETITFDVLNNLATSEEIGEHYAAVRVDSSNQVSETNELNNSDSDYYYAGSYSDEYYAVRQKVSDWREEIISKLQSEYDFPCSQDVYLRLVDGPSSWSGSMTARYLYASSEATVVLLFNLTILHNGYATYEYEGELYSSDSSKEVMYHEYAHAYHSQYVGEHNGCWDPAWFREAFAVYVAGHGPKIVNRLVTRCKISGEALSDTRDILLDGLREDSHDAYDYAESYLAFQHIVNNYGQDTLKSIIQEVAYGTSVEAAIVSNLSDVNNWLSFESNVYDFGRASVEAIYPLVN